MKKLMLVAACATLAACGGNDTDDTATIDPAEPVVEAEPGGPVDPAMADAAGTYEMTATDGTVMMRTVNADGTYTTETSGEVGDSGTVRLDGDAMCYDPDGPEPEACWTAGEVAEDGSFEVTRGDQTMTVRRTS